MQKHFSRKVNTTKNPIMTFSETMTKNHNVGMKGREYALANDHGNGQPTISRRQYPIFQLKKAPIALPIGSMYGIFTYIYHKNQPNVGKYTIHGWILRVAFYSNHHIPRFRAACRNEGITSAYKLTKLEIQAKQGRLVPCLYTPPI